MPELRNLGIAFITFAVLISLTLVINAGVKNLYGIDDNYTIDGKNIGQSLNDLSIVRRMNETLTGPTDLKIPTGSFIDVVGSLAAAGIGALKTIASFIALPIEIFGVITGFYFIPPVFVSALITIVILIVGFVIISKYIGSDI